MVSIDDLMPVLKRARLSYYLPAVTFGYFHFLFNDILWFGLMLISGLSGTLMFVEDEILESIEEDLRKSEEDRTEEKIKEKLDEYSHATPWLYFEILNLIVWGLTLLYIVYSYVTWINWSHDFWLSALGFVNIMYAFGWIVDKIYAQKYKSHYPKEE